MSESVEKVVSKKSKKKESKQEDVKSSEVIVYDEIAEYDSAEILNFLELQAQEPASDIKDEESNDLQEDESLNESLKARAMSHTHLKMKRALDEKPHKVKKYYRVRSGH